MRLLFLLLIAFSYSATQAKALDIQELSDKNGYKAWLVEDHQLPVIYFRIAFKNAGTAYDPPEKDGTVVMLAELLDDGAGPLSSRAFKKELEERAIHLSFSADNDTFYVFMKTLKEHQDKAFELLSLALMSPHLDPEAVSLVKDQILISIAKDKENPTRVAHINFAKEFFGNHPYGRYSKGTPETLGSIHKLDIEAFMRKKFTRAKMVITAVGDLNAVELSGLLNRYLSKIPEKNNINNSEQLSEFKSFPNGKTVNIYKAIPQSAAVFGFEGVKYNDPDFYPAYVMNYTLGGGSFQSRLMDEVREKKGLAYSISTYLMPLNHAAILNGSVGTKKLQIQESIDAIRKIITDMQANGITEEELEAAKNYLIGSFPLKMSSNHKLINLLNFIQVENLGIDFIQKRNKYVDAVTLEDVKRVSAKLLDTKKLITVVVGANKVE